MNIRPYKPINKWEYIFVMGSLVLMLISLVLALIFVHPARSVNCNKLKSEFRYWAGSYVLDIYTQNDKIYTPDREKAFKTVEHGEACFPKALVDQARTMGF